MPLPSQLFVTACLVAASVVSTPAIAAWASRTMVRANARRSAVEMPPLLCTMQPFFAHFVR